MILGVLKHSRKIPSDNQLLKNIETVGEIRGAIILYINTRIFLRSVDLFFCLQIQLTISSLSGEGQKNEFSTGAPWKFNGDIFEWGILRSRLEATFENTFNHICILYDIHNVHILYLRYAIFRSGILDTQYLCLLWMIQNIYVQYPRYTTF